MDLWQSLPHTTSSLLYLLHPQSILFLSHLWHPSIHLCSPCFILHSCIPVSFLFVFMSPWSSCPSHIDFLPCSCFPCFTLPLFLVPDWVKPTLRHRTSLLDTNHRWISNKSILLRHPLLYLSVPQVRSYFCHISNTPPFVPVPLVSPFVPMFPVSLISVSMPLWSSCLSLSFLPPCSCLPLFHTSTFHS